MGEQRSHVALTAFGCALLGAAWLVPVADRSTVAIAAFLLASAAGRAGLNTFSYLLAGSGAADAGAGRGAVIGLVNLSWGVAAVIGPLAASAAHGHIDERVPFGVIAALCLAVATLMLTASRAPSRRERLSPAR
jgi:MFS family permease